MAERRLIAKEDIPLGGVLAFTRGQVVPDQVVADHDLQSVVVGEGTKEAREIAADITGRPAEDFETKTSAPAKPAAANTSEQKG